MDVMQIRRRLLSLDTILPFGYRRVEYLRSSGTQYIDTGYYPKTNTTLDITYRYEGTSTEDRNPFGTRKNASTQLEDFSVWINTDSAKGSAIHYPTKPGGYGTDTGWIYHANPKTNIIHFVASPQNVYVNDTLCYTFNVTRTQFTLSYTAWMFCARVGSNSTIRPKDAFSIYGLSLSEGTTMYRNFIPCVRLSDNKPGMYDTINDVFYTNKGTGEFIIPT